MGSARARPRQASDVQERLAELDTVLDALAHPVRRHILLVLRLRGGTLSAGEIATRCDCAWPTTSRHLGVLTEAGLITVTRDGRERLYHLDAERVRRTPTEWLRWFVDGTAG